MQKKNANKKARRLAAAVANHEVVKQAQNQVQAQAQAQTLDQVQGQEVTKVTGPLKVNALPVQVNAQVLVQPAPGTSHMPESSQAKLFCDIAAQSSAVAASATFVTTGVLIPPVFKTPAPEGPYRDEIVVEVLSLNGQEYVGTITPSEARKIIFGDALGLDQSQLAGITIGFNRGRVITFKLKKL